MSKGWRDPGRRRVAGDRPRWLAVLAVCLVLYGSNLYVPTAQAVSPVVVPGAFVALSPYRVLDTRVTGPKLGSNQTRTLKVAGAPAVVFPTPASRRSGWT